MSGHGSFEEMRDMVEGLGRSYSRIKQLDDAQHGLRGVMDSIAGVADDKERGLMESAAADLMAGLRAEKGRVRSQSRAMEEEFIGFAQEFFNE